MKRKFNLNEFSFNDDDLATPDKLMECLKRTDPAKINEHFYATKLYQAVTNQDSFSSDEWCTVSFPDSELDSVDARMQLQTFIAALAEWHQTNAVDKQFLPDILANSFYVTSWVQEDLTAAGMVPGQLIVKPLDTKYSVEVLHNSPSM